MKKAKILIAAMLALLLFVAVFAGCGKKTEEIKQDVQQEELEYREEYLGDPIDENGNQGELFVYLPEAFEQPAVENIEDEDFLESDVQAEDFLEEIEIDIPEIME